MYPGSEERLGTVKAASKFEIHTKVMSFAPGDHEPAKITASIDKSLHDLQTSSVAIMYLHVPDRQTPMEDVMAAMNEAHQQGKFKRFGVSNYTAEEVGKMVEICEAMGYVKPSVYQGHYNPLVRGGETELFPLLRKHNISFYAYR
jgi:aflatoxin B1 aldehyde reductase